MTANPQDRERLAKEIKAVLEGEVLLFTRECEKLADGLLARGWKSPEVSPAKPPLLTEEQVGELFERVMLKDAPHLLPWRSWSPEAKRGMVAFARAAAEEAIRGTVEKNRMGTHREYVAVPEGGVIRLGMLLSLFGLE